MDQSAEEVFNKAMKIYREGYPLKTVHAVLSKEGIDEVFIDGGLVQTQTHLLQKTKGRGVTFMIAGSVILLTGFIMTVFLFHANHDFDALCMDLLLQAPC